LLCSNPIFYSLFEISERSAAKRDGNIPDLRDRPWWENYFSIDGGWEKNERQRQTRIFAEHFTRHLNIDRSAPFSILDSGCALGMPVRYFSICFSNASLFGIDFSEIAIERSRQDLKAIAQFDVRGIEDLDRHYDAIYCSIEVHGF
jgi:SAM-dependent methyltransferase